MNNVNKNLVIQGIVSAAILFLGAVQNLVFAQTPDGVVPANEGVCDELLVEGVSEGLYGL